MRQCPLMTQCMVRPCVARRFRRPGVNGLASMYPASAWSDCAPGHHGYQRACDLIKRQASTGQVGHQCSHAPGRPILHRRLILSQTSAGKLTTSSIAPHFALFLCSCRAVVPSSRPVVARREHHAGRDAITSVLTHSKARPLLRTAHAMRASLLASAMASTLWCSRLFAASIQDLSP